MYVAPFAVIHLCGLVCFTLFVLGAGRRSIRVGNYHNDAKLQNNTLTEGLKASAKGRHALLPDSFWKHLSRRWGPQASAWRSGHLELHRAAPSLWVGPRRATVVLHAASDPEEKKEMANSSLELGAAPKMRNMLRVINTLPRDYPQLLTKRPDMSIYAKDIELLVGNVFVGIEVIPGLSGKRFSGVRRLPACARRAARSPLDHTGAWDNLQPRSP